MEIKEERRSQESKTPYLVISTLIVLVLLIAGIGLVLVKKSNNSKESLTLSGNSDESTVDNLKYGQGKYQAVFLTDGQVYFGKINSHTNSYVELTNIYYIQVIPTLQQGQGDNKNDNASQQDQQNQITLVKLGNELHGPLDRMMINRKQVVFVEDLKDDSKIVQGINQYLSKQKQ